MSNVRQIMAKGETSVLLRNELDYLDSAERELLLKQAGIISHIGAAQALALKAGIGLNWSVFAGDLSCVCVCGGGGGCPVHI